VGSARDEAELGLLVAEARDLLSADGQGELDLGLDLAGRVARMVPAPADRLALFASDGPVRPRLAAAPRVLRTCSGTLFDALAGVYDSCGFGAAVGDDVFRDLVVARVVEATSLSDADRVLAGLGRASASLSTRKRTLRRCFDGRYREALAAACLAQASGAGDLSLVMYDVTTLRTFADREDEFRKVGYSKIRSVDPQVVVGLLVDRGGFPLDVACFEGNRAEKNTILGVVEAFQARSGVEGLVVVADAGMLSAKNLAGLDEAGLGFVVGARTVKAPLDLESHFRWHGDGFADGQVVDTVTPKTGKNADNDPARLAEPVWDPRDHPGSWRAVWAYSQKRFARDNKTLNAQEERAKQVVAGDKPARRPRFVKPAGKGFALDAASLARARRLAGLKGWVTNIPATRLGAEELIAAYHDLWHVEQSFRIAKTDLKITPLFARKRDAIEAHVTIAFAALAVARAAQTRTGLSIRQTTRLLQPLRSATIQINGAIRTIPPAIPPQEQAILNALKTTQPRH
jgi:hypothetical protein